MNNSTEKLITMANLNNDFTVVKGKGLHSFSIKTAFNTRKENKSSEKEVKTKSKKA